MTATANPSSGPTPGTFILQVSGEQGTVTVTADPSPPNPDPMPDYEIIRLSNRKFEVRINDSVGPGTDLFFTAADAQSQTAAVVYTSN